MQNSEGAIPTNSGLTSAGTNSHNRQHKILKAVAMSVLQLNFFGNFNTYYLASHSFSEGQTKASLFLDDHLDLQKHMRDPVAFHTEMTGDIMYFHEEMKQPDAEEFVKAIMKEVDVHNKDEHWMLVKQSEQPDVLSSIMGNALQVESQD